MTTETAMDAARSELLEAIGLSQAQFASAEGDGFDSAALVEAVDAFEQFIRSGVDVPGPETVGANIGWQVSCLSEQIDALQALEAAIEQAEK